MLNSIFKDEKIDELFSKNPAEAVLYVIAQRDNLKSGLEQIINYKPSVIGKNQEGLISLVNNIQDPIKNIAKELIKAVDNGN